MTDTSYVIMIDTRLMPVSQVLEAMTVIEAANINDGGLPLKWHFYDKHQPVAHEGPIMHLIAEEIEEGMEP